VLQLTRQIGLDPRLGVALEQLVSEGLIERNVIDAQQLLTRMLVMMRLVAPGNLKPTAETCQLVAEACGAASWDELIAEQDAARQRISALWKGIKQGTAS
jgi:glutamate-ammonia-ligase adenylyltransferase